MSTVHYSQCPVCSSSSINPLVTVKDHSVSGESFVIWQCGNCTLRFTQDVPDEKSIGAYYKSEAYISHSNTSKGLVNSMYQKVRNYTLAQKAALVMERTVPAGSILDMGAGIGAFLNAMQTRGWKVTGIEPDPGARQQAKELFNLDIAGTEMLDQLQPGSFDAITLWHVLEHVHRLQAYVEQLKNLLKPGGKIFIAVPNYLSMDSEIYKLFWAAYDVPRHLYHFTPKSIETLVEQHGLKVVEKKPMWFDSFYISLLSSRYKNGKTSWIGAAWSGLRSNLRAMADTDKCSSLIYVVSR